MSPSDHLTPEQRARRNIDELLEQSGWAVQDRRQINLGAAPGVAVREFGTDAGPADYGLFLGNDFVGVVEAKREGVPLSVAEPQTRAYADAAPEHLRTPVRPLPFLYESTGTETWFTNQLDPIARARRVFSFHRPETLDEWLRAELDRQKGKPGAPAAPTLQGRMRNAPPLHAAGMWPVQVNAVENLEASIREGRQRALIAMATGSGKTFTAISSVYRLVKHGGARRVLFLVDRGNLGRQALKEFQAYTTPEDGRKFTELYNVVNLQNNVIQPVNKVVITTIQRLYGILKGEDLVDEEIEESSTFLGRGALAQEPPSVEYTSRLPPDFFDIIVVDECHRSIYSLWRQVLEYFDATIIGLTATPANHTYAFFNRNVVTEYRHEHAVRDKVNVPFQVYQIRTQVTEKGAKVEAEPGRVVGRRDRQTREVRWSRLDEDLEYGAGDVDKSVVVPDQIRTVVRTLRERLFTEIFPGRTEIPKTLIFAKSDDHAEDILRILREEWSLSNEQAVKVTYKPERGDGEEAPSAASRRSEDLIQAFRMSYNPRVAVTVDMISTGTDIQPLECVVFMRSVKSRTLFEQMKGRGVRVIKDADFQAVTPDAQRKTHFVVVDCVGVMEDQKTDPPIDREPSVPFQRVIDRVRTGSRDEDTLSTLAGRLDRMDRQLTSDQKEELEAKSGGFPLRDIIGGILEALDPDREEEKAREMFSVPEGEAPTEEQVEEARDELREEAVSPVAYSPELCQTLLEIRRQHEVTLDTVTIDEITKAEARTDLLPDYDEDKEIVSAFQEYCEQNPDELAALEVLYSRPYQQQITREDLLELARAIQKPPREWTPERLWKAYERLEKGRVKGASRGKLLTDLISLTRHAMGVDEELVSYEQKAKERFENWMSQQENRGRRFSQEQREWLELIRDRIVTDLEVRMEDFDDTPFAERGGLGKVYRLFGDDLAEIVDELNRELVA